MMTRIQSIKLVAFAFSLCLLTACSSEKPTARTAPVGENIQSETPPVESPLGDISQLSVDEISDLTERQIRQLTAEQLRSLNEAQIQALRPEQIHLLSDAQVAFLSYSQLHFFTRAQLISFHPEQARGIVIIHERQLDSDEPPQAPVLAPSLNISIWSAAVEYMIENPEVLHHNIPHRRGYFDLIRADHRIIGFTFLIPGRLANLSIFDTTQPSPFY
jgi:hypothetical protein